MAPSRVLLLFRFYPLLLLTLLLQSVSSAPRKPGHNYIVPKSSIRNFAIATKSNPPPLPWDFKTHFFNQTLDHFNYDPQGYATFQQRYIVNRAYWSGSDAPIFAYLGAEGPLDVESVGFLNDNALHFNSLSVFIEHRFYSQSSSFKSIEEVLKNDTIRGYFNSAQALADYAEILLYIRRVYSTETTPIIVVGEGTYGGLLAAWFRLKYPHIATGALASSTPIFYFDKIPQRNGFDLIVAKDFKDVSENCFQTIRNSWAKIDQVASNPDGLSILSRKFNTCAPLNNSAELKEFLESMYEEAAQYDAPPTYPVSLLCNRIDDDSSNQTDILDRIFAGLVAYRGNDTCQDTNDYNYPTESTIGMNYQRCTELVMPTGIASGNDTLYQNSSISKFGRIMRRCENSYKVKPKPFWVQTFYGGNELKLVLRRFASNIIFSNGLRDPDSSGGVLEDFSKTVVAVTTLKGSHCLDIRPAADTDPDWLVLQRYKEIVIIETWLRAYYADSRAVMFKSHKDKSI